MTPIDEVIMRLRIKKIDVQKVLSRTELMKKLLESISSDNKTIMPKLTNEP